MWEPGDEAWESKLAALRSYRQATGHLAPRLAPSAKREYRVRASPTATLALALRHRCSAP
ncbi:ttrA1 protein [Streptomyces bottropensis ATCC 25435]|uniref:TtrA1 protein n=1 Tax=Streptomyces bottropensis ATCC 25435 TaxID=1054862 RepID=M3FUY7_9ACTN|nr:ttrA1 protein [Streptomyces bottropensis ATCC 25435]